MIGFILFFGLIIVLLGKTIIKDRREYRDWYEKCNYILKK